MRRTSYQRGFAAGELAMVQFITQRLSADDIFTAVEVERHELHAVRGMIDSLGPVATVAGLVGKAIGGADIAADDYEEWAEEELRQERGRIEQAIEESLYFGERGAAEPDEDRARGRALLRVPEHLRDGLLMYLNEHVQVGHFLTAVFENNLSEAFARADLKSRAGLFDLVSYLHNYAPAPAWGGKQQVKLWLTPAIPLLELHVEPRDELSIIDGKTACPGCGGFHLAHYAPAEMGRVSIPSDGAMKREHVVQFVYCHQVHLHVVGIDGKERP